MTSKSGVPSPSLLPEGKGKGPTTKSRSNPIEDNIFTHAEKFGLEAGKKPSKGKLSATSSPTLNLPTVTLLSLSPSSINSYLVQPPPRSSSASSPVQKHVSFNDDQASTSVQPAVVVSTAPAQAVFAAAVPVVASNQVSESESDEEVDHHQMFTCRQHLTQTTRHFNQWRQ